MAIRIVIKRRYKSSKPPRCGNVDCGMPIESPFGRWNFTHNGKHIETWLCLWCSKCVESGEYSLIVEEDDGTVSG